MSYTQDIENVANLKLPWEKLRGCNILITGATGLIGACLVEVLMSHPNKNFQVYASGRNGERARKIFAKYANDSCFHYIFCDVTKPLHLDIKFHYIIHAASNASPNFFAKQPVEVMKSNIFGVCNLLEYGRTHALKRFLYVSTGEIYGEGDGRVFTEDYSGYVDCTKPRSCYPSSKRASETLCVAYAEEYGLNVCIARPSHVYGPNFTDSDNRVYAQFIRNVLNKEDIVMKSNGSQFRSWCYVVDCVSALLYILLKGENGEAYNIADANSNISIRQLAEMIAGVAKRKVVLDLPSQTEKAGFNVVTKSVFDTSKLCSLGWTIEGIMQDKIERTIKEQQK